MTLRQSVRTLGKPTLCSVNLTVLGIKERGQPATSPIVEEINIGHVETGWCIRVRNRMVSLSVLQQAVATDRDQGITW